MKFSGSKALSDAWGLFTGRFGPMIAVVAIYIVAVVLLFLVFGASMFSMFQSAIMGGISGGETAPIEPPGAGFFLGVFALYLVMYALQFVEQAALCRLCSDRHTPNIGDALSTGLRSVLTLLGVAVIAIIVTFVVMFVVGLLGAALTDGSGGSPLGALVPLVMLIGGLWLLARLCMILPVVAIDEERNPIAAIARAWRMTSGSALKIALVLILVGVVLGVVFVGLFYAFIGTPSPGNIPNFGALGLFAILLFVLGAIAGNYIVALIAAIYRQLAPTGAEAISEAFA